MRHLFAAEFRHGTAKLTWFEVKKETDHNYMVGEHVDLLGWGVYMSSRINKNKCEFFEDYREAMQYLVNEALEAADVMEERADQIREKASEIADIASEYPNLGAAIKRAKELGRQW